MNLFVYDKSFEGLLTGVFDAYVWRQFPDHLLGEDEPLPLFYDAKYTIVTDQAKADRVWRGLQKRLSELALNGLMAAWLSEMPAVDELLFRYIRKAIDAPKSIELNLGDPDVLAMAKIWKKVNNERLRVVQFLRFQKTVDGTYFAAVQPLYNVLPMVTGHLKERFADQVWLVYDLKRQYGYYYDLKEITEVQLDALGELGQTGLLEKAMMDPDESLYQQLWKTYFQSIAIQQRLNPRLHRRELPVRFWRFLPEKF